MPMLRLFRTLLDRLFARWHDRPPVPRPFSHLYGKPVAELERLAAAGDGKAAYVLGDIHDQGQNGVARDLARALSWYRRGEDLGDGDALNNLGSMHHHGDLLEQDLVAARRYYERGAAAGCGVAMGNLGRLYLAGEGGLRRSPRRARRLLWRAVRRNDSNAMVTLGYAYSRGERGFPRNRVLALYCYRKGVRYGEAKAMSNLAFQYWSGEVVRRDDGAAVELWRNAALQDHATALSMLGCAYEAGRGVGENLTEAIEHYIMARDAGDEDAEERIDALLEPHPWLRLELARQAQACGDWALAVAEYERLMPALPAHPDLEEADRLDVRARLAFCLHEAERYAEARTINAAILGPIEAARGAGAMEALVVLNNLAQNLSALGDLAGAASLVERRLELVEAAGDAWQTERALAQLARLRLELGLFQDANELAQRRLEIAEESRDPDRIEAARGAIAALQARLAPRPGEDGAPARLM